MTTNQDSVINELKLRIKLLEKQNNQSAGRMGEKLLLWLASETIKESNDPDDLIRNVLDRFSLVLDLHKSVCCEVVGRKLIPVIPQPSDENPKVSCGITVGDKLLQEIKGKPLFVPSSNFSDYGIKIPNKESKEIFQLSFFPFQSVYIPFGFFVLMEDRLSKGISEIYSLVVQHIVQVVVEKFEKLKIREELKELNYSFESKLRERIEEISADKKSGIDGTITPVLKSKSPTAETGEEKLLVGATGLLKNIGVEIRTPLNGIMGFAELLRDNALDAEIKNGYIDLIKSCGNSLMKMVDDSTEYSRIVNGEIQLNPVEFEIAPLLNELYDHFKWDELLIQRKNLEFRLNVRTSGAIKIRADKERLKQILENLIGNAIKFTEKGHIDVGFLLSPVESFEGNDLVFFIHDTGVGISKKFGNRVFQEFYKVEHEISKLQGGMGLGLTIARQLATMMGGNITFESDEGRGSSFYLHLPASVISSVEEFTAFPESNETTTDNWDGKVFLVVEDDEMSYIFLREILKTTNATVLRAKEGKEAIEIANRNPSIDLILMDIKLPQMSGLEVTRVIKGFRDVPIVAQTAYAMADDQKKIIEAGCDDYITKPINRKKLMSILRRFLTKVNEKE